MSGFGPTCSVLARPDKEKQRDSRTILYNHGTVLNRSGTVLHRSGQQFQRFPTPAADNWQAVGKEVRLSFGGIDSWHYTTPKTKKSAITSHVAITWELWNLSIFVNTVKSLQQNRNIQKNVDHACTYLQLGKCRPLVLPRFTAPNTFHF